jgi:hypothetical protein
MKVPGSNLLRKAFKVIAKERVDWYRYDSETINAIGMSVKTYSDPIEILGSFQPVSKDKYEQFGLDFQKAYAYFFTSNDNLGVSRDYSGDYIVVQGTRYYMTSDTLWYRFDGWNQVLVVKAELNNA